jgi:radical SAM protein with 4Fe4S-binding SPASM domain
MNTTKTNISGNYNFIQSDKGFILIHKAIPKFFITNPVGLEIIKSLNEGSNSETITTILAKKYNLTFEKAKKDVNTFLEDFNKFEEEVKGEFPDLGTISPVPKIKRIQIDLVSGCNLTCLHCGVPQDNNNLRFWDKNTLKKIIKEFLDSKEKSIGFSGGEPMLHPDWLEIVSYARKHGKTSIATNCTLLKDQDIEQFSKLDIVVQVSLESPDSKTNDKIRGNGNFDLVLLNLKKLVDSGMGKKITICMTLTKHNSTKIKEMVNLAREIGLNCFRLLQLQKSNHAALHWNFLNADISQLDNAYESFYDLLIDKSETIKIDGGIQGLYLNFSHKLMWCQIGSMLAIDIDGNAYPCSLLMNKDFYLGNVVKDGFKKIEDSRTLLELAKTCFERKDNIEECKICSIKSICQSGCPATSWNQKNDIYKHDDLCQIRIKHFLKLLNYVY